MPKIKYIRAREILDSRGNPTIACEVELDDGTHAAGYVPAGASTGQNEAHELRDGDENRYNGRGVLSAVSNVNNIIFNALVGMEASDLPSIDQKMIELDSTPNKSKLGANSTLSVSLAVAKAAAKAERMPLYKFLSRYLDKKDNNFVMPIPFCNILNGGKHAVGSTDFQEFMVVPVKFASFRESIRAATEIYHALGNILKERNYQPLVGDEGGFAPALFSNEQAMELLIMAIKDANYNPGEDVFIALDPAASRFYTEGIYQLYRENRSHTTQQMIDFYSSWVEKYPIISIEDALDQNDWNGWIDLTQRLGNKIELIGDDLYATNKDLLQKGIEHHASTGILIKPNQIGTLSETLETIRLAEKNGFKIMISHRSGETEDDFIADLAIASGCGTIKAGAPCRTERTVKYNRIAEIEEKLGEFASFATWDTTNNGGISQL